MTVESAKHLRRSVFIMLIAEPQRSLGNNLQVLDDFVPLYIAHSRGFAEANADANAGVAATATATPANERLANVKRTYHRCFGGGHHQNAVEGSSGLVAVAVSVAKKIWCVFLFGPKAKEHAGMHTAGSCRGEGLHPISHLQQTN